MLSRVYVVGEDAAHTDFVRGFLAAYGYPSKRIGGDLSAPSERAGRRGDGKALVLDDASISAARMSRQRHLTSLLVVVHDLDLGEVATLRARLLRQIANQAEVPESWLRSRSLVLLPEPETEGWIAQMVGESYRPGNGDQKQRLKKRAFEIGREVGRMCFEGQSDGLPEPIRSSCALVSQHVGGLR